MMLRVGALLGFLAFTAGPASARVGYVQSRAGGIYEGHIRFESNAVIVVNAARELWMEVALTNIATLSMELAPVVQTSLAQQSGRVPEGWMNDDVGTVGRAGGVDYISGGFRVRSSGTNVVAGRDSLHFVYKEVDGTSEIVARVTKVQFTDPWARAGLMMRESLSPDSRNVFFSVTAARGGVCHWRETSGEEASISLDGLMSVPCWLKLRRDGEVFTALKSSNGKSWSLVDRVTLRAARQMFVGMAAVSMREGVLNHSVFEQVEEAPSLRNRWFVPQIELQSGSAQLGYVASMDDTAIRFDVAARKEPVPSVSVANIRFQPVPPRMASVLASGRIGVLLATGEFVDGECRKISRSKVTISSIPLGLCYYDINSEVVVVVFRKRGAASQPPFEVRTADGSVWLGMEVAFDSAGVLLREPVLGARRIPVHEIVEFRRRT